MIQNFEEYSEKEEKMIKYSEYVAEELNKMREYDEYKNSYRPKIKVAKTPSFWNNLNLEVKISTIIGVIGIILSFLMLIEK